MTQRRSMQDNLNVVASLIYRAQAHDIPVGLDLLDGRTMGGYVVATPIDPLVKIDRKAERASNVIVHLADHPRRPGEPNPPAREVRLQEIHRVRRASDEDMREAA